jgi:hypothetical protein
MQLRPEYFLDETRRHKLVDDLQALGMPYEKAVKCAFVENETALVDAIMALTVATLNERITALGQSTNASERHQLDTFLKCDATIIAAFREETVQRFGNTENFPLWSVASSEQSSCND